MLLSQLFENKHMTEADIASVNWNTDSKQDKLNEFAPGAGGDDEAGDDPYKYPKPEQYRRSADYFGQFEADHFDREDFDDAAGEFKGYWGDKQIAYFKFDNPARTGSDDPGRGWYYEPQSGSSVNNTSAAPAVDSSDERTQQELSMIRAFLKSGNQPSPGSQIYNLMKRHGVAEGALNEFAPNNNDDDDYDDEEEDDLPEMFEAPFTAVINGEKQTGTVIIYPGEVTSAEWHLKDTIYIKTGMDNIYNTSDFITHAAEYIQEIIKLDGRGNNYVKHLRRRGQGIAEAPGAETLSHNQSIVASNLNSLDLDEGWKEKLAAAGLAGAMALGAGAAQARVVPDGQGGVTGGFGSKPVATQMAPAAAQLSAEMPNQNLQAVDNVERTTDGITIAQDGKSYDVKVMPKGSPTPRGAKMMKVNQAQIGERGIGSYVVYLLNNGTAYLYMGNVNEGDISQLEKDVADAPVAPIANMEAKEKVGNMDADAFDAAMARLKKLAGAGPMKTVWDPARRVYKNVPTAVQPKK